MLKRKDIPWSESLARRMEKYTAKGEAQGCWEWTGCVTPGGYGLINSGRKGINYYAHRVAYLFAHGLQNLPPAYDDLDHLCRNRACVNPAHLEPVTRSVNILRGDRPRTTHEAFLLRTHCVHGHPYTPENTIIFHHPDGYVCRHCRRCNYDLMRQKRAMRWAQKTGRSVEDYNPPVPSKAQCPHGHAYTPQNTYFFQRNGRTYHMCRSCRKAADQRHKAATRAAKA